MTKRWLLAFWRTVPPCVTFAGDKVTLVDVIGDRARLRELEIVTL